MFNHNKKTIKEVFGVTTEELNRVPKELSTKVNTDVELSKVCKIFLCLEITKSFSEAQVFILNSMLGSKMTKNSHVIEYFYKTLSDAELKTYINIDMAEKNL